MSSKISICIFITSLFLHTGKSNANYFFFIQIRNSPPPLDQYKKNSKVFKKCEIHTSFVKMTEAISCLSSCDKSGAIFRKMGGLCLSGRLSRVATTASISLSSSLRCCRFLSPGVLGLQICK